MKAITAIFEGIKSLLNIPKEYAIDLEGKIGTKAIIAIVLVGAYAVGVLKGMDLPAAFVDLAKAAALLYIGYSTTKTGFKK